MEMKMVFWAAVAITLASGVASITLSARAYGSAVSYRIADRLAQVAVVGASVVLALALR